jgi:hypothetical protein
MKYLFIALIAFLGCGLSAQPVAPMRQTTFYFEDAVGNRDTIVVGADRASNEEYNPQFGELDLPGSFDSVFEVRATHKIGFNWGQPPYILSKKNSRLVRTIPKSATMFCRWGGYFFCTCKTPANHY